MASVRLTTTLDTPICTWGSAATRATARVYVSSSIRVCRAEPVTSAAGAARQKRIRKTQERSRRQTDARRSTTPRTAWLERVVNEGFPGRDRQHATDRHA